MSLLLTLQPEAAGLLGRHMVREGDGNAETGGLEFMLIHGLVNLFRNDNYSQLKVKRVAYQHTRLPF